MGKKPFIVNMIILWIALNSYFVAFGETPSHSPEISEITGEIESITSDTVRIIHDGLVNVYPLSSGTKIICNGATATWKSLIPITSEAFFEATLTLDNKGRVLMIDGSYQGEEGVIRGWFYHAGQLNLQIDPVEKKQLSCKTVRKGARLPREGWLHDGQLVFIVYDRIGQIRAIYLPD